MNISWKEGPDVKLAARHAAISDDGSKIVMTLPGIDYEDFYRFGDVSAWKVMKYFSVMRILGALRPGFCVNDVVDAEHSIFVVQSAIDLKQSFYGRSRDRRMWLPLRLSMELMSFGRSTLNLRSLVHEGGPDDANFVAENALVSGQFTIVRVNFKTRRSAKLPDDFVKRYAKFMTANYRKNENNPVYRSNSDVASSFGKSADSNVAAERVRLVPNKFNAVVRRRHFVVCPSDCDFNMHTSNVVYVRFCFDCATLLTSRGGSEAGDDIGALRVRRILSRFVGESRAGDVICVTMWPDELRTDALHFRLTRDEDTLFEMTVDFYENLTSLHFWREQIPAKL